MQQRALGVVAQPLINRIWLRQQIHHRPACLEQGAVFCSQYSAASSRKHARLLRGKNIAQRSRFLRAKSRLAMLRKIRCNALPCLRLKHLIRIHKWQTKTPGKTLPGGSLAGARQANQNNMLHLQLLLLLQKLLRLAQDSPLSHHAWRNEYQHFPLLGNAFPCFEQVANDRNITQQRHFRNIVTF